MQIVNRDDQKFAMKCSAALVNGEWVDVFKDPITDKGKRSKKGKMKLAWTDNGLATFTQHDEGYEQAIDVLEVVFENGELKRDMTFEEIRANAAL